ncbi:MAG: hypothetical protein DBY05_01510 [Clostridiales bacterium]|nr:MAG: hypothetical protein DBY05_01510 [Clostridiales bacterium]
MKKRMATVLLGLIGVFAAAIFLFVGCGGGEVVFSGILSEYTLKASESDFDFLNGVSATQDGKTVEVSVDDSAVEFGKSGEYKVIFSAGKEKAEAKVKIYGTPTYTAEDVTISYGGDPLEGIVCKDSFGTDLTVTHTDFEKDASGRVLYKAHKIAYTATDVAGNKVEFSRNVTVTDTALTMIKDTKVDLISPKITWIVGANSEIVSVKLLNGDEVQAVDADNYTFSSNVGRFAFKPEYLASLETDKAYLFDLTFSTGYKTAEITVTDKQLPAYTLSDDVDGAEFCEGEISLPVAEKAPESYQKIKVEYFLNSEEVADPDAATLKKGSYEYKIVYKRGGEEIENASVTMNFEVMEASEYYGRPIKGEKFLSYWNVMVYCTNRPATANNRVEIATVDSRQAFHMINDLVGHEDDCRGFYFDMAYLDGIRKAGFSHLSITFKMELDSEGRNNFFIDYYETDSEKLYNGKDHWRGGNGEYWGKAADMKGEWATVTIPMNESSTSELFFLSESQGFYIESIVPVVQAAYVAEATDTDAFGMEVAVQCGEDTLSNLKLFYNASSNSAEAALKANWISVGRGIDVAGCGNITPVFTSHKAGWGSPDATDGKRYDFPRLTDPSRDVHNQETGKAYIRWQIVNGESSATLEIYYFFPTAHKGSGEYEKILSVGNLPLLRNGYAGFIVNDGKDSNSNLTEFLPFNGVNTAEKISAKGAVIDFNTQCALSDQFFSIRLFYNAKDKNFASIKSAPSVFFANGTGENEQLVAAENISETVAFNDPNSWGKANAAANSYNFPGFREAASYGMHDGNSGRVYVRLVIYNDIETGKGTLEVYYDNRSNDAEYGGKGSQVLVLKIAGLDPVQDGFAGIVIDDSVFSSHWFEKTILYTEGFSVKPYEPAYSQSVAADKDKVTMTFDMQCGESIRNIRLFYNAADNTLAGANAGAGLIFAGDVVTATVSDGVSFEDARGWGNASDTANAYNLPHMQKAHEKAYHDPNSGLVTVKIEIENIDGKAVVKMYYKNPATGDFDLILTVSGMDELSGGYAGLIVDNNIISHKHIKNFVLI